MTGLIWSNKQYWLVPTLLSLLLLSLANYDYLAFHTFAEVIAVCIAVIIAAFTWQTYEFSHNNFLMLIGVGYLCIAALDLMHLLTFLGMDVLTLGNTNTASQFWITARTLEAAVLLIAPLFYSIGIHRWLALTVLGVLTASVIYLILTHRFPDTYLPGGLTTFEITLEYLVEFLLFLALCVLYFSTVVSQLEKQLIGGAIIVTMIAELIFALHWQVAEYWKYAAHIFKAYSFWLI